MDPLPSSPPFLDWQQRVLDEARELDDKINKLRAFSLDEELFLKLAEAERERLLRQLYCMEQYSAILGERIAAFY